MIGVVFGVAFVSRQRGLRDPLLDLSLFANRSFTAALAIMLSGGVIMGGIFLFVTQYLQLVEGLSPLVSGLWMFPATVAMIAGTMLAPAIAQKVRPAYVMAAGMLVAALGFFVLTIPTSDGSLAILVVGFTVGLFGSGLPGGLGINMIVGAAPPEKAGSASAMSGTSQELGLALGFATLGSLGAAVYRGQMAGAPSGVPDAARESLAGAVAAAEGLPNPVGAELLDSAREAFTTGLNATAGIGAAVFACLAVLAVAALRHVPVNGEARPDEAEDAPAFAPMADHDMKEVSVQPSD